MSQTPASSRPSLDKSSDKIDPTRAGTGFARWRRALAETIGQDPGASLDEPRRSLAMLKVFGSTRRLAELCLSYPAQAATALTDGPSEVLAEAARDLTALGGGIGGAEALHGALAPIKARADIAIGLAEISGQWSVSEATAARSDLAERLVETALAWLVRSAVSRGELTVKTEDGTLENVFVLAGGDFAHEDLAPVGPLDLVVVYKSAPVGDPAARMAERAFVRIAAELREAFEGKPGDYPVFSLRTPIGSCVNGAGLVETDAKILQTIKEPQNGSFRRWMSAARVVAGDRTAGGNLLEAAEAEIWGEQPIFTEKTREQLFKESDDPRAGFSACADIIRWSLGRNRAVFRTASAREVFSIAANSGVLSHDVATRLIAGLELGQTIVSRVHLMKGSSSHSVEREDEQIALAALCNYADPSLLAAVRQGAIAEARNSLTRLIDGAQSELARYRDQSSQPDDIDKLQDLGFRNGNDLSSLVDGWASLCSESEPVRFASVAPGLLTEFGETQHPDEAVRLFDAVLHGTDAGSDAIASVAGDANKRRALVDAFGSFGRALEPLSTSHDAFSLFANANNSDAVHTAEEFLARHPVPEAGTPDEIRNWRHAVIAETAFLTAAGTLKYDVAADTFAAIHRIAMAGLFNHAANRNGVCGQMSLHVFETPAFGLPGAATTIGFIHGQNADQPKCETAAREFVASLEALGDGIFSVTPNVSHRPGGVAGALVPDISAFKGYIQSEAIATDQILLARARVIAGPEKEASATLRLAVTNPRRSDILFRDLDRARVQRMRHDRAHSHWDLFHAEGGLYDTELIISTLIYRHGAAQPGLQNSGIGEALDLMARSNLISGDIAQTLKAARRFWLRLATVKSLSGWTDPEKEPVRTRFAALIARAVEVEDYAAVRPMMRGYADEVTRIYSQLVLGRPSLSLVANG